MSFFLRSRRRPLLRWLASVVLSAGLLAWLLSQIETADLWLAIRDIHRPSLMLFLAASLAGLLARAYRYRLLLGGTIGLWPLTLVTLVRNLFVDLVPARLGSLSYVYLITARCGVPIDEALASFFLAFVFDAVAMAPLLLVALLAVGGALPTGAWALAAAAGLLLGISLGILYFLAPSLKFAARLLERLAPAGAAGDDARNEAGGYDSRNDEAGSGRDFQGLRQRAAGSLADTATRIEETWQRGAALPVFGMSLAVRVFKFGAYYCLLHAVLVPHGYDWGSLNFFLVFLGVAGAELSATLPIHSLAGFGTYELAWAAGFTLLGFPKEIAILSGIATHLISQAHDYTLGLIAFVWIMRPRRATK